MAKINPFEGMLSIRPVVPVPGHRIGGSAPFDPYAMMRNRLKIMEVEEMFRLAETNPTLKEKLDEAVFIYKLARKDQNGS